MSKTGDRSFFEARPWRVLLSVLMLLLALGAANQGLADEAEVNPLSPPDTSSPAATLKSFRDNMEATFREFYDSPTVPTPLEGPSYIRAVRTLDTSQLPSAQAERLSAKSIIQLNEVLDHVVLPQYDQIPDIETLRSQSRGGPIVYRIPNTGIEIVEMEAGPRKGEFLFSAATLDRLDDFYDRSLKMAAQPGTMKGLSDLFSVAPGRMIPRAAIEGLPDGLKQPVFFQAIWKWLAMFVVIGVWAGVLFMAHRYSRSRGGDDHRNWQRSALALFAIIFTHAVRSFLEHQILVVGPIFFILDLTLFGISYLLGAVLILNLGKAVAASIIKSRSIDPKKIDAHLISLTCDVAAWLLVIVLLAYAAHELGVPIEAVLGSLGVGGLAGALAARPTLENLIAGVTLYLDKPVRVGDFCQFGDVAGSVEEIGLRSTRLRQWDGNLISVPNSQFADFQLINYSDMKYILLRSKIALPLDTSTDQLRYVLTKLNEMLHAHPKVEWPRLRLAGFGQSSLKVQLTAYINTINWGEYHGIREDIYFRVLEIIEQAGTHLAVPTRLIYQAKPAEPDKKLASAAENEVKAWREAGELPFPDMPAAQREALAKSLDFPPEGSVDFVPKDFVPGDVGADED